jgi:hypothetical protein
MGSPNVLSQKREKHFARQFITAHRISQEMEKKGESRVV